MKRESMVFIIFGVLLVSLAGGVSAASRGGADVVEDVGEDVIEPVAAPVVQTDDGFLSSIQDKVLYIDYERHFVDADGDGSINEGDYFEFVARSSVDLPIKGKKVVVHEGISFKSDTEAELTLTPALLNDAKFNFNDKEYSLGWGDKVTITPNNKVKLEVNAKWWPVNPYYWKHHIDNLFSKKFDDIEPGRYKEEPKEKITYDTIAADYKKKQAQYLEVQRKLESDQDKEPEKHVTPRTGLGQ